MSRLERLIVINNNDENVSGETLHSFVETFCSISLGNCWKKIEIFLKVLEIPEF